jgi:membrane-associated phospholipid phosphatase
MCLKDQGPAKFRGRKTALSAAAGPSFPSNHAVNASLAATFSHFYRKAALPMFFFAAPYCIFKNLCRRSFFRLMIAGAIWGWRCSRPCHLYSQVVLKDLERIAV